MQFIILVLHSREDYNSTWVAWLSSHTQTVSHRDLTWSQLQSSSVPEPGIKWGLHFPSPPISLYDYINVHKNIFVLNA